MPELFLQDRDSVGISLTDRFFLILKTKFEFIQIQRGKYDYKYVQLIMFDGK